MTYEEFKEEFMDKLDEKSQTSSLIGPYRLFENGETSDDSVFDEFIRETNIKYSKVESNVLIGDFLSIIHKTIQDCYSRYEMKYLYENFQAEGWDRVWEIIEHNLNSAKAVDIKNISEAIDNYEAIKDNLIIRAINYTDNKYSLKDAVYKKVGDIALVLYIYLSQTEEYGLTTTKAKKSTVEKWDVDMAEIMETALINSNLRAVPRIYNEAEASNPSYEVGAYMAIGTKCKLQSGKLRSVFTTYPHLNGATSFWYPGVKEKISEMAGGDYYVVFTGIHDFHVHPVGSVSPRQVLMRLKNMNRINPEGEILSRKIYLYQADDGKLKQLEL